MGVFFAAADFISRRAFSSAGLLPSTISVDPNTTIHCWLSPSLAHSRPSPTKPIVLLLHGFGPSATWQWRFQIGILSRHFDLVVPDLIFFGGSTTRSAERSERFQAAAVAALLVSLGIEEVVEAVVGTSYGGFVAYHVARLLGERGWAGKVVIASSDLGKTTEDEVALLRRAGGVGSVSDLLLPMTAEGGKRLLRLSVRRPTAFIPGFVLRDIFQKLSKDNYDEKIELLKGVTVGNKDLFQLSPLTQHVLIIWGEHDGIFPVEKAFELNKKLGEKARLEVLKNTGHVPQLEDPAQFNKILLSFLLDGIQKA
ncbi:hypothetical protein HPP92_001917 [Vanilla planifolia]|uniref:AB hydrolase-1 domain-containing protein n=1 Tax=Vanilla planifolia TaxID=51239 RepID=A0A835S4S9_VANPL|nr:hypothetical protein HPP92_002163 [Vanilla planifolia]KAG0501845.1 hypothetical protein HPP92_001917 [Vanilla planifolia]